MQAQDYATVAVALITIIGACTTAIRWMVKHYLSELRPNGGSSLKDSVDRLELRVDEIMTILMTQSIKPKRKVTPSCNCTK